MTNAFDHENTIYGSYGEFLPVDENVDWSEHDAQAADYFAEMEAEWEAEAMADFYDYEPSPYDGTYSEM